MQISICNANATVNEKVNARQFNALHNASMQTTDDESFAGDVRNWLQSIIQHYRSTASQVASRSQINPSTLTRFMNGETSLLSGATLQKLAASSPVAIPLAVQMKLDQSPRLRRDPGMNVFSDFSEDKIPVWGVHPVQRDGEFKLNPVPVTWLEKLPVVNKSLKVAAFFAPDETMAPRWNAGEPVLFDRAKAASTGEYAIIKMLPDLDPNGDETYLFRRIARRSNGMLQLEALDAEFSDIHVPISRILEVRHVLSWSDIIG